MQLSAGQLQVDTQPSPGLSQLGSGHAIQAGQARSKKMRLLEACTNRFFLSAKAAGHSAKLTGLACSPVGHTQHNVQVIDDDTSSPYANSNLC